MSYLEMATDAGYTGDEAKQFAQMLEWQDYDAYMKHLEMQEAEKHRACIEGDPCELCESAVPF